MKRAVFAVAFGATVAASTGVASAGGYIGLGIGTSPAISSDGNDLDADGRSGRLMLGYRFGRISVEGGVGGFDMFMESQGSKYPTEIYQGFVSGKYNLPLSDGFEAFGRVGLQRTWLKMDDDRFNAEGSGLMLGVGMEYRLPLSAVTSASLWIDYQYSRASLNGDLTKTDLSARMWTLGATIGF